MLGKINLQDSQVALVFNKTGFDKVIETGSHFLPFAPQVQVHSVTDFLAKIADLEWLTSSYGSALAAPLEIVRTGVDEVALACSGQSVHFVPPNTLQPFWKKGLSQGVLCTKLADNFRLPQEWGAKLPASVSSLNIKQASVAAGSFALLFVDDVFCDFLLPSKHAYFEVYPKTKLVLMRNAQVIENKDIMRPVLANPSAASTEYLSPINTTDNQICVWWDQNELVHVSPSAVEVLARTTLNPELITLQASLMAVEPHIVAALRASVAVAKLLAPFVTSYEVPPDHVGLLQLDRMFERQLSLGFYAYWHEEKRLSLTQLDGRLTMIEITGQEILTQDKVPVRVNVTASYKIINAQLMVSGLNDYKDFVYKEIQFALRAAIGSKTLDDLLENKNRTDEQILSYTHQKALVQGIEMVSLGIKDLIFPSETKAILGKVVKAEKAAQANVIRRRKETAATRSLMNTSKVIKDNPVVLRLKELETLEKITEKIDRISVFGGIESLLKQVASFKTGPDK